MYQRPLNKSEASLGSSIATMKTKKQEETRRSVRWYDTRAANGPVLSWSHRRRTRETISGNQDWSWTKVPRETGDEDNSWVFGTGTPGDYIWVLGTGGTPGDYSWVLGTGTPGDLEMTTESWVQGPMETTDLGTGALDHGYSNPWRRQLIWVQEPWTLVRTTHEDDGRTEKPRNLQHERRAT